MARYKRLSIFAVLIIFLVSSSGCEAFVRKFTRQKKYQEAIEPVLNPETNPGFSMIMKLNIATTSPIGGVGMMS